MGTRVLLLTGKMSFHSIVMHHVQWRQGGTRDGGAQGAGGERARRWSIGQAALHACHAQGALAHAQAAGKAQCCHKASHAENRCAGPGGCSWALSPMPTAHPLSIWLNMLKANCSQRSRRILLHPAVPTWLGCCRSKRRSMSTCVAAGEGGGSTG